MNISLKKRNVLITGGAGGIGTEIVKSMYSLGANILISGSNEKKLEILNKAKNDKSLPLYYLLNQEITKIKIIKDF